MATQTVAQPQAASTAQPAPGSPNTDDTSPSAADASTASPPASSATANTKKTPSSRPSSLTKNSPSPITRKVKRSFWENLWAVLIPCGSSKSTSRAHDVEPDTGVSDAAAKKARAAVAEKGDAVVNEKEVQEKTAAAAEPPSSSPEATSTTAAASGPSSTDPTTPAKTKSTPPALTVPAITTTPIEQDGDVALVVPPSPHSHLLPREETEGVTSGAVQAPGSTGDATFTTDAEGGEGEGAEAAAAAAAAEMDVEDEDDEEERLIMQGGTGIPTGPDGQPAPLLPPMSAAHKGRKCLVLDLDETLLHSSFKLIPQADYVVPVEIEWQWHNVYVIKRPGVDNFLKKMGELYEVVIFTASLSKYADPVLDKLDVHKVVAHRLFRESCYNHKGNYVKDLSRLGRPIEDTIILDNSPASYIFHPNNAVPVSSWFNDPHDTELTDLCPFLADLMSVEDVRGVLDGGL